MLSLLRFAEGQWCGLTAPKLHTDGSVRFLKNTPERIFVLVGKRQNVGYLFLGFLSRVGTTDRFPLPVGAKHVFARLGKLISKKTSNTRTTNSIGVSLSFKSTTS
jgi:hypothetical protein